MSIMQKFQEGGVFMYFILLFGLFTIGFIVERGVALYVRLKSAPSDFRQKLLEFIARGDLQGAATFATTVGANTSIGRIALVGINLRQGAGGEEELQARLDEKLASEISNLDRRTGFLAMFGNVATLLGLLGTISGMIQSFAAVASASPSDRAMMLSKGISEAMNCTAFGLIVAIPALVAFAIYQNRTDRIVTQLTGLATEIYHDLLFLTESALSPSPDRKRGTGAEAAGPGRHAAQAAQASAMSV